MQQSAYEALRRYKFATGAALKSPPHSAALVITGRPLIESEPRAPGRIGAEYMTSIGGFSRALLKQGAGMFCAAMWSVGDEPARKFTETLYEALKANDNLAQATVAAREKAAADGEGTWLAYTVYGNPYAKLIP